MSNDLAYYEEQGAGQHPAASVVLHVWVPFPLSPKVEVLVPGCMSQSLAELIKCSYFWTPLRTN
jgi:hypothetical protein